MEKRIGTILIQLLQGHSPQQLNEIISSYGEIILGRQGIPFRDRSYSIVSLLVEGTTDEIGALSGKIGKLSHVKVKSAVLKA